MTPSAALLSQASRRHRPEIALLAGVTLLAAALRFWHLGLLPPGLHVDEAYNILDARAVMAGWRPVFLPANAGREVLFTYLQAPFLAALGESPFSARLVSALAGTLTVPALWAFARSLGLPSARSIALLASTILGVTYWHLHFSRFGIRAVLFPLVVTLALWAWWRAVGVVDPDPGMPLAASAPAPGRRGRRAAAAAGLLLGAAVYTHPVGRGLVAVPALHAAWRWARRRDPRPARALVVAGAVGLVVAVPAVGFWAAHPWTFSSHAEEVSIVGQGPAAVASNGLKVVAMFNVAGDPAGWRNLTHRPSLTWIEDAWGSRGGIEVPSALRGRPVFDPVMGLLFLYGLVLLARAALRGTDWAVLASVGLATLLLPSVVTDAAPNFSRAIGALPLVCLLPALALDRVAAAARDRWGRWAGVALVALVLGQSANATVRDYFGRWAEWDAPAAFDAAYVALGRFVDDRSSDGWVPMLWPEAATHPTVRVSSRTDTRSFDPSAGLLIPSVTEGRALYLSAGHVEGEMLADSLERSGAAVAPHEYLAGAARGLGGAAVVREAASSPPGDDLSTWLLFHGLTVESARAGSVMRRALDDELGPALATFPPLARLVGGVLPETAHPGQPLTATLVWQALGPHEADLHAFVHLVTPDGRGVSNADAAPLAGSYPTSRWRPGDVIINDHVLVAPDDPPLGRLELRVGWYDLDTGQRLPIDGAPAVLREGATAAVAATTTMSDW